MGKTKGKGRRFARFFVKGFLLLLALELGVFLFLDKIYLQDTGVYKAVKIAGQSPIRLKQVSVDSGSGVSNYQCAYDGGYISYLKNGSLVVVSLKNGKKSTVPRTSGMSILAYRWIYDRDRILIVEKSASGSYAKLCSYNTADKAKTEIDNAQKKQALTIPLKSGTTSASLDMSTLTNLTYLKLTAKSGSQIYKIDVNVKRQQVSTVTSSIGNIAALKNDAVFLYEDSRRNYVYKAGSSRALSVMNSRELKLLGSDINDTVYFAVPESGKTRLIYYGSLAGSGWHTLRLSHAAALDDIQFTVYGGPYEVDAENGTLTRLLTGAHASYKGTLLGIYNEGFFSLSGETARVNALSTSSNQ